MIKQNRSVKAVCGGKNAEENLRAKTQFTAKKTGTDIKNMQYILVTGAYGGMGRATVQLLKKQGFFVFALDRKIGEAEENVFPIEADITDESSLARAAETIKKKTDALFAIVHYAGIYMLDSLAEIDRESFERIFRINLFGAFLVNKTFLPFLRKGGRIVITTSELAPDGIAVARNFGLRTARGRRQNGHARRFDLGARRFLRKNKTLQMQRRPFQKDRVPR